MQPYIAKGIVPAFSHAKTTLLLLPCSSRHKDINSSELKMLDLFKQKKEYFDQKPSEKLAMLKIIAGQKLGGKWAYFHKIKHAGEGFSFLKEANLVEQMKATQAALKFISKHTRNTLINSYKTTVSEVGRNTGLKEFPKPPEETSKTLSAKQDAIIIQWCPLKFLLPAKLIREKGLATQRHSEGLIAKLYFKVVGFYAHPENWNGLKLTHYLYKIDPESNYQDISQALDPLKKDLLKLAEIYEMFKFGKASLQKETTQDVDSFDDAMGVESFEDEIRTLYWYYFIYQAMEDFLFRYYVTLSTATDNIQAIRYLASIFEPAIARAIEVKTMFLGSFETDASKKKYIKAFEEYSEKQGTLSATRLVKTKKAEYEVYNYNISLLQNSALEYDINELPEENSEWATTLKHHFLGFIPEKVDVLDEESDPVKDTEEGRLGIANPEDAPDAVEYIETPLEVRRYAMIQLLNMVITANQFRKEGRSKVLDLFKNRVKADREIAQNRILKIRKEGEKKIRTMERKISKLKRMKQEGSVQAFEDDVEKFKAQVTDRCNTIIEDAKYILHQQKLRLQKLFNEITEENKIPDGISSHHIFELTQEIDRDGEFSEDFIKYVINCITDDYRKELEPLYENLFAVLAPSTQEKVMLIQALEKSGGVDGVKLALDEIELEQIDEMVAKLKTKIMQGSPDIFESKVIYMSTIIPLEDLFEISITNKSLAQILKLKVTSPKSPKAAPIRPVTVKALLVLNLVKNPIPAHNLIQEGREGLTDPTKVVNTNLLHKLLAEISH